jgi:hypothetical protein
VLPVPLRLVVIAAFAGCLVAFPVTLHILGVPTALAALLGVLASLCWLAVAVLAMSWLFLEDRRGGGGARMVGPEGRDGPSVGPSGEVPGRDG